MSADNPMVDALELPRERAVLIDDEAFDLLVWLEQETPFCMSDLIAFAVERFAERYRKPDDDGAEGDT